MPHKFPKTEALHNTGFFVGLAALREKQKYVEEQRRVGLDVENRSHDSLRRRTSYVVHTDITECTTCVFYELRLARGQRLEYNEHEKLELQKAVYVPTCRYNTAVAMLEAQLERKSKKEQEKIRDSGIHDIPLDSLEICSEYQDNKWGGGEFRSPALEAA